MAALVAKCAPGMKICTGCSTVLHNCIKTCSTCGATFGKPPTKKQEPKRPGAVKDGEALTIFIDENDKTGAKAVTLKDLKQEIDGVDDDAKVEFLVDLPKGTKNFKVSHAFVGGKVRPLKLGGLFTSTVHGHARSIRGWKVDFSASGNKRKDGTEEETWLKPGLSVNTAVEVRPYIEDGDEDEAFKEAKRLVRGSIHAPRVKADCARVTCKVANVHRQLICDFTGEGDDALEDAISKAGWQVLCNVISYLKDMETNKVFLALSPELRRDAQLALEGRRYDHETFEGHGHVTMAVPLGTQVQKTAQGEQWSYRDESGAWKPAKDRADAEKKALLNPRILEEARKIEEHKLFVAAIDGKLGVSDASEVLTALPNCFARVDGRRGRNFIKGHFTVLNDAFVVLNCRMRRLRFPAHFIMEAPGDTPRGRSLLVGNREWLPTDFGGELYSVYRECADEERTTGVKAIVRFNQVATERDLDVELFSLVYGHRCDAEQIKLLRDWGGFKTALLGDDSTYASVLWTLDIVKVAADLEPSTWTTNPIAEYFYSLATGDQMACGMDATRRINFQEWFEAEYGEGATHVWDSDNVPLSFAPAAAGIGGVAVAAADLPPEMATAQAKVAAMPPAEAEAYVHRFFGALQSGLRASIAPAALAPAAPAPAPAPEASSKAKKKRKSAPKASKSAAATATARKKSKSKKRG